MFQNTSKNLSESLKSPDRKIVPVQVRPRAPYFSNPLSALAFAMCIRMCDTFVTQIYVLSRCEHHYFNRRVDDKILRLSLHATDKKVAQERATNLYLLTNKCMRLSVDDSVNQALCAS